jgi:hypothetical protein
MEGDFSILPFDPLLHGRGVDAPAHGVLRNIEAVLHQQGRVITDADLSEGELLDLAWNGQAGRDIIGAGVCAVPAAEPQGFRVQAAFVDDAEVMLSVVPGRAWADGILARLAGAQADPAAPVARRARYFGPPLASPLPQADAIGDGTRDAVILEVSEEAVHGFQYPERLIEPALGGPDTAERAYVNLRFRLLRLAAGEDCGSILGRLQDGPAGKGRLSVSLAPPPVLEEECPVVGGGGYLGFEHQLYRIEIADGDPLAPARFKWSQWNGGLVGRGVFDTTLIPARVLIDAGHAAIVSAGPTEFYLEALQYDALDGAWNVVCGVTATLNADHALELGPPVHGALPTTTDPVFFRLWNGLRDIADFTDAANPVELRDGIRLVFDAPAAESYRARDYWTFSVRAGEIPNRPTLLDQAPPLGIVLHRVALAEIEWTAARDTRIAGTIEDCRRRFRPLTRQDLCCTVRVGDGTHSFGDFDTIQAAIDALPAQGGQVCVLPGEYVESIVIDARRNIRLTGCGLRSRIVGAPPRAELSEAAPVIHVRGGQGITIDALAIVAHASGAGVVCEGADPDFANTRFATRPLTGLCLRDLDLRASAHSAVCMTHVRDATLRDCRIRMQDSLCLDPAVFALGDDLLIEHNLVEVAGRAQAPGPTLVAADDVPNRPGMLSADIGALTERVRDDFTAARSALDFVAGTQSRGGIQIGGTSDRVRIIDNLIRGGAGNGITLGSLIFIDEQDEPVPPVRWPRPRPVDPCDPALPANVIIVVVAVPIDDGRVRAASAGSLSEVLIERNRIQHMGMNGIGVAGFFDLSGADEFISVEGLSIVGNDIRHCLRRSLSPIAAAMIDSAGYGGIALADVERLVVRDNLIADNGPSHVEPVCGIFILHGEGVEISRNRILDNGARTEAGQTTLKAGRRGGINIVHALAPVRAVRIGRLTLPGQGGDPALVVRHNVVSVPLGQALSATALGPVVVEGNQFTSRGVVQSGPGASFAAATVALLNLGLSNEFYLQFLAFSAVARGALATASLAAAPVARPGLDDQRLGAYLAGGNVLFANNQCLFDVIETGISVAVSSVAIFSLDDVAFLGNQCDCNLADDVVIAHVVLFGFSLRACDNRLKESLLHALFSAITLGFANTTALNQSTHCLLVRAFNPSYRIAAPNTVLVDPLGTGFCERTGGVLGNFGRTTAGGIANG